MSSPAGVIFTCARTGRSIRPACDKCVNDHPTRLSINLALPARDHLSTLFRGQTELIGHGIRDAPGRFLLAISEYSRIGRIKVWKSGMVMSGMRSQWDCAGSVSRASRSAMRRSWKRRLERAALSRSSRVRLSVVSWRTRCLRVVFSVVIRWMASSVHSASRSRIWPRSSPMRVRWVRISAWAALRASSAFRARSRQVASRVRRPRRAVGCVGRRPPGSLQRLRFSPPDWCRGRSGRRPRGGRRQRR